MLSADDTRVFEDARPGLLALAYRILGSVADAEDAVQDTFLKWSGADRSDIRSAPSWLTTTCTRRCLDLLRAAHRSRVNYVGVWLPEPVQTVSEEGPEDVSDLASSLSMAFLLLLERLTPKERAAYLLRDIFDLSYADIADALDIKESACRKLVSRAKANVDRADVRNVTSPERQEQLLAEFENAVVSGSTERLASLLSSEIRLSADGGGKVPAVRKVLHGVEEVVRFLSKRLSEYWAGFEWSTADINGTRGIVLRQQGAVVAIVSFAYDTQGAVTDIYIVRNPDKLADLGTVAIH